MDIGTVIQEDEFRSTLSFIRGSKASRCDMLLRRTRLFLSVLWMRNARVDSKDQTWSLNVPEI